MADSLYDVVGIGNAIVDVLAQEDDDFLVRHGLRKGAMTLIDAERAESLYAAMGPAVEVSGGSAANTIAAIASLGGRGAFIGKTNNDQLGAIFRHDVVSLGVAFGGIPATDGLSYRALPDRRHSRRASDDEHVSRRQRRVGSGGHRWRDDRQRADHLPRRLSVGQAAAPSGHSLPPPASRTRPTGWWR